MRFHHRLAPALMLLLVAATRGEEKELVTDQQFLLRSIRADTAEIRMAELALKTSADPEIRAFAKTMVADHTEHRREFTAMARAIKSDIPEGMSKDDEDGMAKLAKLTGKAFDAAYVKMMVSSHEKVLKMDRKWEKEGANAKIRDAAKRTADAVGEHLAMAKKLKAGS